MPNLKQTLNYLPVDSKQISEHNDMVRKLELQQNSYAKPDYKKSIQPSLSSVPTELTEDVQYDGNSAAFDLFKAKPYKNDNNKLSTPESYQNLEAGAPINLFEASGELKNLQYTLTPDSIEEISDLVALEMSPEKKSSIHSKCIEPVPNEVDGVLNHSLRAIRGFLYDLLHFDTIKKTRTAKGLPASTLDTLVYIVQREGRYYSLLFFTFLLLLFFLLVKKLYNSWTQTPHVGYIPFRSCYPTHQFHYPYQQ